MAVEEQRLRIRRSLEEKLGVEETAYLMDRPPGGWADLVTNQTLDLKLAALEHKLIAEMERRFRQQTWTLMSSVIAAMALMSAIFGGFLAAFGS